MHAPQVGSNLTTSRLDEPALAAIPVLKMFANSSGLQAMLGAHLLTLVGHIASWGLRVALCSVSQLSVSQT